MEKYTAEVIHLMDTYDENRDGRFEMNELAKALKIEENYLNKIINKKSIKDKHIQVNQHISMFSVSCDAVMYFSKAIPCFHI